MSWLSPEIKGSALIMLQTQNPGRSKSNILSSGMKESTSVRLTQSPKSVFLSFSLLKVSARFMPTTGNCWDTTRPSFCSDDKLVSFELWLMCETLNLVFFWLGVPSKNFPEIRNRHKKARPTWNQIINLFCFMVIGYKTNMYWVYVSNAKSFLKFTQDLFFQSFLYLHCFTLCSATSNNSSLTPGFPDLSWLGWLVLQMNYWPWFLPCPLHSAVAEAASGAAKLQQIAHCVRSFWLLLPR